MSFRTLSYLLLYNMVTVALAMLAWWLDWGWWLLPALALGVFMLEKWLATWTFARSVVSPASNGLAFVMPMILWGSPMAFVLHQTLLYNSPNLLLEVTDWNQLAATGNQWYYIHIDSNQLALEAQREQTVVKLRSRRRTCKNCSGYNNHAVAFVPLLPTTATGQQLSGNVYYVYTNEDSYNSSTQEYSVPVSLEINTALDALTYWRRSRAQGYYVTRLWDADVGEFLDSHAVGLGHIGYDPLWWQHFWRICLVFAVLLSNVLAYWFRQ